MDAQLSSSVLIDRLYETAIYLDSMVSLIPPKHYFSGDNQSEIEWQKRTQKKK